MTYSRMMLEGFTFLSSPAGQRVGWSLSSLCMNSTLR